MKASNRNSKAMENVRGLSKVFTILRKLSDMSVKELSRGMITSMATIYSIEAGRRLPTVTLISRYSTYFHIPVAQLFWLAEETRSMSEIDAKKEILEALATREE